MSAPSTVLMDTPGEVRRAQTEDERLRVFRLRYEVFVEEMRMPLANALAERQLVRDPEDDQANLYYCEGTDGQLVATSRLALGTPALVTRMDAVFDCHRFLAHCRPEEMSFSARLAIRSDQRSGPVLARLGYRMYADALASGSRFDLIVCTPGLLALYESIGYRRYKPSVCIPDLGYRLPLVLDVLDVAHLRAVRSPLVRLAAGLVDDRAPLTLDDVIPDSRMWQPCPLPAREIRVARLATAIERRAGSPLARLDRSLLERLLTRFRVLRVQRGDTLLVAGTAGDELFVLLHGAAVRRPVVAGAPVASVEMLHAGQCIGIGGFLAGGGPRREQVVITEDDTDVLVIDRGGFDALNRAVPELAPALLPALKAAAGDPAIRYDARLPAAHADDTTNSPCAIHHPAAPAEGASP